MQRLLEEGADDIGPPVGTRISAPGVSISRRSLHPGRGRAAHRAADHRARPADRRARHAHGARRARGHGAPPPPSAALTLDPAHAGRAPTVTLIGRGYAPGEAVGLRMTGPEGANHELGTAMVDPIRRLPASR